MKREILFRGKAVMNTFSINEKEAKIKIGDWVYGAVIPFDDGIDLIYQRDPNNPQICGCHGIEVDHNTVGQYTGLHDCNGKEIYDGDIIRSFDSTGQPIIHSIVWLESCAKFVAQLDVDSKYGRTYCDLDKNWIDEFCKEVIGNIHEK